MAHGLNENGFLVRRIIIVTFFSVVGSVALTVLALRLITGGDPNFVATSAQLEWFSLSLSTLTPALICPLACYRSAKLMAALAKARHDLDILARTDQLTGLLNRRGFDLAAVAALQAERSAGRTAAVLICDVDHFKKINDCFGHSVGDQSLIQVAKVLTSFSRDYGLVVGRQGGDEFAMLLPNMNAQKAAQVAEAIRAACAGMYFGDETRFTDFSVSVGVAVAERAEGSLAALMRRADAALYEAKQGGRDRVFVAAKDAWQDAA